MPQLQRLGASIHYETLGDGPPLLMLAGTASDSASWRPLMPLLSKRFRLILIDNRGSGRTQCDRAIDIGDMADDAAALLDHLTITETYVVGHSLGGFLALILAARRPQCVRRVVTMTTGSITPKIRALFDELERVYHEVEPQLFFRLLYQWLFSAPFFSDPESVAAAAEASASYPFRQSPADFSRQIAALKTGPQVELTTVRCPVLALAAGRDLLGPPSLVAALHAAIPDHRVEVIEHAAHSIHWEAPDAVAKAILEFLR